MYNNGFARLLQKEIEELSYEKTTYYFEVEDFYTYYVREKNILVHNLCFSNGTNNVNKVNNFSDAKLMFIERHILLKLIKIESIQKLLKW